MLRAQLYNSILSISICLFSINVLAQSTWSNIRLRSNIVLGFTYPINHPITFPPNGSDIDFIPNNQDSNVGFEASISALKELNKVFSLGVSMMYSSFSFVETGNIYSAWSPDMTYSYKLSREFNLYHLGVVSGIDFIDKEINSLILYTGLYYEEFLSHEGIYIWNEDYHQSKYSTNSTLEYGHSLNKNLTLVAGLSVTLSLSDYFRYIAYRPIKYGVSVGIMYRTRSSKKRTL